MAIPFLNNINLSDNQLLNAKLQVDTAAPTAAAGQIYFNSTDNVARYHNATTWVDIPRKISVGGASLAYSQAIDLVAGTNVGIVEASGTITISSTDQFVGTLTGIGAGSYISVDNTAPAVPVVNALGSEAATPSKLVARDASGYGYVVTPNSGDSTTKIATTAFVQSSLTGLLEFKGGFNASTGAIVGGGNLTSGGTRVAIEVGDYYVVTADGDFFGNTATPLTTGDSVIVQTAAIAGASVEADFIVVQSDTDLATLTTVGIGNVNEANLPAGTAPELDGLSVVYTSGTAAIGLDINNLPNFSINPISGADLAALEIPLYNGDTNDSNEKISFQTLLSAASKAISYAKTITDTDTNIQHGLNTSDVMVQLYDVTTGETVYADVDRISSTVISVTFAATPTNSVRVLVQKIG